MINLTGTNDIAHKYIEHIIQLINIELRSGELCSSGIIKQLIRILIVKSVYAHLQKQHNGCNGMLRAFIDPTIGPALELMHTKPNARWTVDSLAKHIYVSRSFFSKRFTDLVGKSPIEYLTNQRMQKACLLLQTTEYELKEVANIVGYKSVTSFSKAFSRWTGKSPYQYKRNNNAEIKLQKE